ncbi:phosphoglucomutase/phosphomannomutase family protein [bacterium]
MIEFGTSGWRGIIADDFTMDKVRIVSQAISEYLLSTKPKSKEVIVGYDTRFMGENFAKTVSGILAGNGFIVSYCPDPVPTPVISYEIVRRKVCGGVNITASHNPYYYSGIKFSPAWGGAALPETTDFIEKKCKKIKPENIKSLDFADAVKKGKILVRCFRNDYLKRVEQLIDFNVIKRKKLKIALDTMHGAGIGYIETLLEKYNIPYKAVNTNRDCMFGGRYPEPSAQNLELLSSMVKSGKYNIGIALDGDADRFGIIDSDGSYISANEIIAVLVHHLAVSRKWKGNVVRSIMTTSFVDAVAKKYGLKLHETPVGFKYIGDILVKQGLVIGGEESGGLTIKGHIPEKDGIIACLLTAEMMAVSKKSVRSIINDLQKEVGTFFTGRINFRLKQSQIEKLKKRLKKNLPKTLAGIKIKNINTIDGYKFILETDEWAGIRLSGTEPVVRYYVEAHSKNALKKLVKASSEIIK